MKIEKILFSDGVREKIAAKHSLSHWDVTMAIYSDHARFMWDESSHHGVRMIVRSELDDGRELFAALSPVDPMHGIWKCITAFCPGNKDYS